jgi:transposase
MQNSLVYVGMDVHKESITMAMLIDGSNDVLVEKIENRDEKIRKFFKKASKHGEIKSCYEASSCGYVLWRKLEKLGYTCDVIAPSTVPKSKSDKVKTDRRDATALVKLYKAGMLSAVTVPTIKSEMDRSLVRLHDQKSQDVKRNKHRILKFLQTRGLVYQGKNFSRPHKSWLKSLPLENEDRFILDEYTAALDYDQLKLSEIDKRIDELSREAQYADKVDRLKSLRGIDTLSAMILVSEIGDCSRFNSPHELMSYAGLVPSENSSVDKRRQGKTGYGGNRHVRFILVEAAWHYRRKPLIGRNLAKRQQG